ncbi:MAG: hypothetical protein AAFN74_21755 [Myxococcota bacterium]
MRRDDHLPGVSVERTETEVEEAAFAAVWKIYNTDHRRVLRWILTGCEREPTDEEMVAASTVIQWLGTTSGQAFLHEVADVAKRMGRLTVEPPF